MNDWNINDFMAELAQQLSNSNIYSTFESFMRFRYVHEVWKAPEFTGSMFAYTWIVVLEEVTEVEVALTSGSNFNLLEELSDLYCTTDAFRIIYATKRIRQFETHSYVDPFMIIKRISKLIRYIDGTRDPATFSYVVDAVNHVFEYVQSKLPVVYKSYDYRHINNNNFLYYLIAINFVKGLARLYNRPEFVIAYDKDRYIKGFMSIYLSKLLGKVSRQAIDEISLLMSNTYSLMKVK